MIFNVGNPETLKWRKICSTDKDKLLSVANTCTYQKIKTNLKREENCSVYVLFIYSTARQYHEILRYFSFPVPTPEEREFHRLMVARGLA